jgi:hypothetical protein
MLSTRKKEVRQMARRAKIFSTEVRSAGDAVTLTLNPKTVTWQVASSARFIPELTSTEVLRVLVSELKVDLDVARAALSEVRRQVRASVATSPFRSSKFSW